MECGAIMPLGRRLRIGLVNCMAGSEESNHLFGAFDTTKAHRLGNGARDQPSQFSRLMEEICGCQQILLMAPPFISRRPFTMRRSRRLFLASR